MIGLRKLRPVSAGARGGAMRDEALSLASPYEGK